jgi:ABC-type enterochelin transport system substrate-binding protein
VSEMAIMLNNGKLGIFPKNQRFSQILHWNFVEIWPNLN